MTVSEFPGHHADESEPDLAASEGSDVDLGPDPDSAAPAVLKRGWWFGRRRGTDPLDASVKPGQDLERLVQGIYRFGARFSQPSPLESRLRAEIAIATRDLEVLTGSQASRRRPWAKAAAALIGDARSALESGQIVDGWQLVRAARRHMMEGRKIEEVEADLVVTRRRLAELAPNAAEQLQGRRVKDPAAVLGAAVRVRGMLDAYLDELDRLIHQKARMLGHGAVLLISMLVLLGVAVLLGLPVDVGGTVLAGIGTYLTIVGLGMVGAIVSRAISGEAEEGHLVQSSLNPVLVHLLRVSLGGAGALVVLLYLQSGIQGLVDAVGLNAYPFALAAGFSERLADRVFTRTERSCAAMASRALGIEDT